MAADMAHAREGLTQAEFAPRFAEAMDRIGMSGVDLARGVAELDGKCDPATISRYRNPKYRNGPPPPKRRRYLERVLGVKPGYLDGLATSDLEAIRRERMRHGGPVVGPDALVTTPTQAALTVAYQTAMMTLSQLADERGCVLLADAIYWTSRLHAAATGVEPVGVSPAATVVRWRRRRTTEATDPLYQRRRTIGRSGRGRARRGSVGGRSLRRRGHETRSPASLDGQHAADHGIGEHRAWDVSLGHEMRMAVLPLLGDDFHGRVQARHRVHAGDAVVEAGTIERREVGDLGVISHRGGGVRGGGVRGRNKRTAPANGHRGTAIMQDGGGRVIAWPV